ncbi:MAG TPA: YwaF family protein, partial [Candidatus Sulfopaludibacter sp.]|nr:YwaF family protein [Candidatus Sulfopaludibacter sp.]
MRLFGPVHSALLSLTALAAALLAALCRRRPAMRRAVRLALGLGIMLNEIAWWIFRYSHEGIHLANLPLQLCDLTVWATVLACLSLRPPIVEFAYFAGLAGAGMALLTPDLWSPWPSYPAIYFFVAHGGIVIAIVALVFGDIAPLRPGALWRAYVMLLGFAALA